MALISCALDQINEVASCDRGGIRAIYWTNVANIDFDTMKADALQWDSANQEILGYTMLSSAVFNKVEFDRKTAFYEFNYSEDSDVYALLLTLGFKGKDKARRNSLQSAIKCCGIIAHIYSNDGTQRVVGIDFDGDDFNTIAERLKVGRHSDVGGQVGSSKANDEIDLVGESFFAPLFANVQEANIPL